MSNDRTRTNNQDHSRNLAAGFGLFASARTLSPVEELSLFGLLPTEPKPTARQELGILGLLPASLQ